MSRKDCFSGSAALVNEGWREVTLAARLQAVRQNGVAWEADRQTLKHITLPEDEGLRCEVWDRAGTASTTRDLRDV